LPLGLHFGNNFFGSAIEVQNENAFFQGSDEYISATVLAILYFIIVFRFKKDMGRS
tara:strand:+ start:20201 stop:20368 length:168 start_codon:yes stop_codon:yes gene_type:complete